MLLNDFIFGLSLDEFNILKFEFLGWIIDLFNILRLS